MTAGTPPMPPLNRLLHNRSTSGGSIKAEFMRMGSETELNGFGIVNGNGGGPSVYQYPLIRGVTEKCFIRSVSSATLATKSV